MKACEKHETRDSIMTWGKKNQDIIDVHDGLKQENKVQRNAKDDNGNLAQKKVENRFGGNYGMTH